MLFFFFQAEDGIRVFHVTGVQTCALPIYFQGIARLRHEFGLPELVSQARDALEIDLIFESGRLSKAATQHLDEKRSEERRGGREWRRRRESAEDGGSGEGRPGE